MQLVIPMSGVGQRFRNKGYKSPKPLIEISQKPIVQHVVEMFPGVEEVLFIVNKEHLNDKNLNLENRLRNICNDATIAVIDSHKLGPAWAILQASDYINLESPVVINYCDFACTWNFQDFRTKLESGIDGLIATYSGFHPHMLRTTEYAYLNLDDSGTLIDIREKKSFTSTPMSEPASSGTYGFRSGQVLLDAVNKQVAQGDSYNNEFYSSLTYKNMITSGHVVKNFQIEKFFQWGTPEDFEDFKNQKDFFTFKSNRLAKATDVDRIEILAAGAGKRFSDAGYREIKPFLPLKNSFLALQAIDAFGKNSMIRGILLQNDSLASHEHITALQENSTQIRVVPGLTKGQAESALFSLSSNPSGNCIIGTCDSLVFPKDENFSALRDKTIGVWLTKPNDFAIKNASQFGWVELDSRGLISKSWIKGRPEAPDEKFVITGTFYFGDVPSAIDLLNTFLAEGVKVNGEYYLDSLLEYALESDWKVIGLFPQYFISLGTPEEYETYRYWEALFDQRPDLLVVDEN